MNANELADKLENKDRLWSVDEKLMLKTCAMLRQQQAEIKAAEQQVLDAFERGKMFGYAQGLRKAQEK